jgi:phospholipid N-methyltransferase
MYKKIQERMVFLTRSLSGKVGAISASSRFVIKKTISLIDGPLDNVVEYGAGTGVMTKALLQKISPTGKLTVIESDPHFIKILKQINDPRLHIVAGDIQDQKLDKAHGYHDIDLVVSSIPFSLLKLSQQQKIISATRKMLTAKGSFILFHQYRRLTMVPLRKNFKKVTTFFEIRNIFPSFILHAEK